MDSLDRQSNKNNVFVFTVIIVLENKIIGKHAILKFTLDFENFH